MRRTEKEPTQMAELACPRYGIVSSDGEFQALESQSWKFLIDFQIGILKERLSIRRCDLKLEMITVARTKESHSC